MGNFRKTTQLQAYGKQMTDLLTKARPDLTEEQVKSFVKSKMLETRKDLGLEFEGQNVNIHDFDRGFIDNRWIMTGAGSVYLTHEDKDNDNAMMLKVLSGNRKRDKAIMFKHLHDEERSIFYRYELRQLTWKLLSNSYYGVLNARGSQFYDPHSGTSTTSLGVDIITTTISLFEKFLTHNIFFRTSDNIFNYINNIISETPKEHKGLVYEEEITVSQVMDSLTECIVEGFTIPDNEINNIEKFLTGLPPLLLRRVYYKNNLFEFFNNTNFTDQFIEEICDSRDLLNLTNDEGFELPKHMVDKLESVWTILEDIIFYDYQDFDRFQNAFALKRKAVLITDTDSNFIHLAPIIRYFESRYPERIDTDNIDNVISISSIFTFQLTKAVERTLYKLSIECGIPEDHSRLIAMKNEFLSSVLMLTDNKKQYAQKIIMNEGIKLKEPKLQIKGLSLIKVTANPEVRERSKKILSDDILNSSNMDISKVIKNYKQIEKDIYASLGRGETKFAKPAKVNSAESYKTPFQIQSFRGSIIWNKLFPEKEIVLPTKVNLIKLNITSWEQIESKIDDPALLGRFRDVWDNENLNKNGINVIALNTKEEQVPEALLPFVDKKLMVASSMSDSNQLIKSIGMTEAKISSTAIPTNVITL